MTIIDMWFFFVTWTDICAGNKGIPEKIWKIRFPLVQRSYSVISEYKRPGADIE